MYIKEISDRVKKLILHPETEWSIIQFEQTTTRSLILHYALPLAGAAALATFIGVGLLGGSTPTNSFGGFGIGLVLGINRLIEDIATILLGGWIIDALAPY